MSFALRSAFGPTGDQPQAITKLEKGLKLGYKNQVLLGVTGSGKTFTVANLIQNTGLPTLVISHNKTLAAQLYQELCEFFPKNAVSYFVSYYDYYQPEAYVPSSDTYIEKEADINDTIDKLRLAATTNLMTRSDVIVVASVSAIYNIGNPEEYGQYELPLFPGLRLSLSELGLRLVTMQYARNDHAFTRGTFRVRGAALDLYPAYQDTAYRIEFGRDEVKQITAFDPLTGQMADEIPKTSGQISVVIYPAKHYLLDSDRFTQAEATIRADLEREYQAFKAAGKLLEAQRLLQRTNYDLETIKEMGYLNGIENYSRYFDGRKPGERPYTLPDYFRHRFGDRWLTVIDESHMTVPQIRGMYRGDRARKRTLIDYGFRLEAAIDNRPLKWEEFYSLVPCLLYVSATPDDWELSQSQQVVEQLVRPTGIIDPVVELRPVAGEVEDLAAEIKLTAARQERTLVTTLTKKMAEDLAAHLNAQGLRAKYLHSDIKTLERTNLLDALRQNEFDALIGVNLLREGLDLPEVSLVAILDADHEGFLRSRVSLIQTMGRAARHTAGRVILYADQVTGSLSSAMQEVTRRRRYQLAYNKRHHLIPESIQKPRRKTLAPESSSPPPPWAVLAAKGADPALLSLDPRSLTPTERARYLSRLERHLRQLAREMNFEAAIKVRDKLRALKAL